MQNFPARAGRSDARDGKFVLQLRINLLSVIAAAWAGVANGTTCDRFFQSRVVQDQDVLSILARLDQAVTHELMISSGRHLAEQVVLAERVTQRRIKLAREISRPGTTGNSSDGREKFFNRARRIHARARLLARAESAHAAMVDHGVKLERALRRELVNATVEYGMDATDEFYALTFDAALTAATFARTLEWLAPRLASVERTAAAVLLQIRSPGRASTPDLAAAIKTAADAGVVLNQMMMIDLLSPSGVVDPALLRLKRDLIWRSREELSKRFEARAENTGYLSLLREQMFDFIADMPRLIEHYQRVYRLLDSRGNEILSRLEDEVRATHAGALHPR